MNKELAQAEGLKQKVKEALEGFKDSGRKKINWVFSLLSG
jgi:hypothetical protein